ncbi:terephthalate dihydrodiol dehydrogenase [Pseudomonas agarici]|uniref:Terephthalate dihydrodiol dehydrogenase n=2 Tax=Pseudomonas agarici TaxID=46677 RepID=A0A0X1T833_PSEAA|nr:4-hydroxythreonine-4-phosphate dehydrogenase PdxA [Pseudomonas agarici]AMB88132.1 terephthalate dihydrodiol dehydrogenase [Pseudomonas agarici]NWB93028.1 4-hydroxythreonine-4-phosphate dehydrogenase PdxA [Pseudomonas agarici]NWC09295.1 4-hydroxythreonine-4-phosphate dehydrogenase PdxA [Pseudomonas agarici]SEK29164.1 4-hydroxythreonine-4-phosphate dehydrogenase [Pseudomonas agarici]
MSRPAQRILLSIGDPNGIGPEIAVKSVVALQNDPELNPVIVGDRFVVEHYVQGTGLRIEETDGSAAPATGVLHLLAVPNLSPDAFLPGQVSAGAGAATVAYLSAAVACLGQGRARGIVACPHSETAINAAGITFSGYPNLLARLVGVESDRVFLMLIGAGLRIVHATLHERLADSLARLTPDLVVGAGRAAVTALQALGIAKPRIGVFGINPHAGENGLFGQDDEQINVPAIERLRQMGIDAHGPVGADLMLGQDGYDAFIAMYHDQGHIPIKLLAGRTASALSIGAGLIFSSVGHGSAFDIAGKDMADPQAVIRALRLVGGTAFSTQGALA